MQRVNRQRHQKQETGTEAQGLSVFLLADGQRETSVDGAAVGGVVISRLEVSGRASGVASLADGLGARGRLISGLDGETKVGELGAGAHVDTGEIPEDSVTGFGVLELEDVVLLRVGGQLDGDTTAVGVGLPLLGVLATVGRDDLHGANLISDGPGVDVLVEVVGDLDAAAGGTITANDAVGEGRGNGGEEGSKAERLGEHHLDREWSRRDWYGYDMG